MRSIILIIKGDSIEAFTTLTKACIANKCFSYHYLKGKKFPFTYGGYEFIKLKIN